MIKFFILVNTREERNGFSWDSNREQIEIAGLGMKEDAMNLCTLEFFGQICLWFLPLDHQD